MGDHRGKFISSSPLFYGSLGSFPWSSLSYPSVFTIFLILGIFIQWGGNYYWLRAAATRSEKVARWQYILGAVLVVSIVHGSLGVLGLYAGSVQRDAFMGGTDPMSAYGLLLRVFPPGIALFGLVAALAATISTTSNAHMGITSTLVRDIYHRFLRPRATGEEVLQASRLLTLVAGIAIWLLCFYPGGPYFLLAVSCAMLGPAALIFLLGHRWTRITAAGAFWGTLIGMVVMVVYEGLKLVGLSTWSMHTVVIGTVVTLPIVLGVSFMTEPKYGRLAATRGQLSLTADHRRILGLVGHGYTTMVEITDFLTLDSARGNGLIEELEQEGLLRRCSLHGPDFFSFVLTPLGEEHLVETEGEERPFVSFDSFGLQVCEQVATAPKTLRELGAAVGITTSTLGAVVSRLDRLGYIRDGGIWERRVSLSHKGRKVLEDYHRTATGVALTNRTVR